MGFGDHGGRAVWAPFLGHSTAREVWWQDNVDYSGPPVVILQRTFLD